MDSRTRRLLPALGIAILFLLPLLPEILGTRRLIFRDAQITHWPWRRVAMAELSAGRLPLVNGAASGGEPLLANPNAALLYPTVLLEKLLPPASAFNLHYLLQVVWAFFGARALARRLGSSPGAAFFSGVAFAFSGMMLSYASAFMNSSAAAAWMPWCAAAALDLSRSRDARAAARSGAALALSFGLQLLAGEPAISLISAVFCAFLVAGDALVFPDGARRIGVAGAGGLAAATLAAGLAAALLLPLSAVLPLTYRGQHLYSERAFGASPFAVWRAIEWLLPRFGGDPGALGAGAHWQYALHSGDLVYVWCVTFGVLPLLVLLCGAAYGSFWSRRAVWLAAGGGVALLFALGTSFAPARLLFSIPALRRLRYPIKLYLVTTLCVALLAGFAVDAVREPRRRKRHALLLGVVALIYVSALVAAAPGGWADRRVGPLLAGLALPPAALLPAIRASVRADALLGLASAGLLALFLFARRRAVVGMSGRLLAFAALLTALPWALPLFVSADQTALSRRPAILGEMRPAGPVYVSPRLPEFNVLSSGSAHPRMDPTVTQLARVQLEELIPQTGAPFGVRYAFDSDPDGSYGYYNRLCQEALAASSPAEKARLLRTYGARWMLQDEGPLLPGARAVTGFEIAGRRLLVVALPDPPAELRWASRAVPASSLSGALSLVRADGFDPYSEVVLPGRSDAAGASASPAARLTETRVAADRAGARVDAGAAGHLVFSRTYFGAWKARVDGVPARVLVANARDLAVAVPAGTHRVEFEYDRSPFRRGVALQAAAFLAIAVAAAWTARR
jgi:hypothetical protein